MDILQSQNKNDDCWPDCVALKIIILNIIYYVLEHKIKVIMYENIYIAIFCFQKGNCTKIMAKFN